MNLIEKTAEALYLTATARIDDPIPYNMVSPDVKDDYERLAITALTVAYREPVLEEING